MYSTKGWLNFQILYGAVVNFLRSQCNDWRGSGLKICRSKKFSLSLVVPTIILETMISTTQHTYPWIFLHWISKWQMTKMEDQKNRTDRPTAKRNRQTLDQACGLFVMFQGGGVVRAFIRRQSRSKCLFNWSVAALTCLATFSDATEVLKILVALLTSSRSWPLELWVSSPVSKVLNDATNGVLISTHKKLLRVY